VFRINSADFSDGGLTTDESRQVCQWLDAAGLDLIELSGGTSD
jgi:2,4-dienoyl-CoA reductase-like NADH-dependent reductase (Old Yellow Enzyme family)